uniref:Uncharacterized protein n=1 Tax=Vespula pensylvanica TaxID=30213 RepID=A0A834NRH6_VESPE|nr:hypothetical protein H0235_011226 [Vespula pensylvanica]
MVFDASTIRLVILLGVTLYLHAGDYSTVIPSIFAKNVEKNDTNPNQGPIGPPIKGSKEILTIDSTTKKESEKDNGKDHTTSQNDDNNQDGLPAKTYLRIDVFRSPGSTERDGTFAVDFDPVKII